MTSRPASYDNVSKFLHWSTALLLVAGFFIGENADGIGYGFHVSIGIAILVLTGLRILWRLTNPAPRYPETMSGLEKTAASLIKLA
jgi:cytochrome b561